MSVAHTVPTWTSPAFINYMQHPVYGDQSRGAPASSTWAGNFAVRYLPVIIPTTTRFYRGYWLKGATVGTNNFQVGLYTDGAAGPDLLVTSSIPALSAGTANLCQFVDMGRPTCNVVINGVSDSTTDGTTFTTGSVTLQAGRLYTLSITNTHGTSAHAISSIDNGPAFTSRGTVQYNTSLSRETLLTAVPATGYTGTLVINFGANTETGCAWRLMEWNNVDTATNDGIVQAVTNSGTGTTPSVTLAAFGSTNNATLGQFGWDTVNLGTPGTGFFEISDDSFATPGQEHVFEWRPDNDTSVDYTIGVSSDWGGVAAEVKASLAPTDGIVVAPGRYWLAMFGDGVTATIFRNAPSTTFGRYAHGYGQTMAAATGSYLPNVATPATVTAYQGVYGFTTISSP